MAFVSFAFSETSPSSAITTISSQPVTGSSAGAANGIATNAVSKCSAVSFEANLIGATGGTLDIYIQQSANLGTDWYDLVHFPQLASGASAISYMGSSSRVVTSNGVTTIGKSAAGSGAGVALAANAVAPLYGDQFRLVMVGGTSTTAGAAVKVNVIGYFV